LLALVAGKRPSPILLPTELTVRMSSLRPARKTAPRRVAARRVSA
jgi:hypothetical protein